MELLRRLKPVANVGPVVALEKKNDLVKVLLLRMFIGDVLEFKAKISSLKSLVPKVTNLIE